MARGMRSGCRSKPHKSSFVDLGVEAPADADGGPCEEEASCGEKDGEEERGGWIDRREFGERDTRAGRVGPVRGQLLGHEGAPEGGSDR